MQQLKSFAEVNANLRRFYPDSSTDYTLDKMLKLMDYLSNPQNSVRVIHVAGTSGKTSTCYYIAALLSAAGQKTGLTVSPHVDELNERLQINGIPVPEEPFRAALSEFLELVEKAPVEPSWFEVMIAFFYWYFAREQVDYAVVEVGLGGLKDATNATSRADKVCVITDIGFDHMNILGNTLAEIATQKAGIIRAGNAVFSYDQAPEIMAVLRKSAGELHVVKAMANPEKDVPDYQFRNGYLAYNVYKYLAKRDDLPNLSDQELEQIKHLLIPGRMDVVSYKGKKIVMDGAHNAQKMEAFVNSFRHLYPDAKPAVLLALREGKDFSEITPILAKLASRVIVTTFESNQDLPIQSMPANELAAAFSKLVSTKSVSDQKAAFKELVAGPEPVCVVTGSLYLLGQIRNNEHLR